MAFKKASSLVVLAAFSLFFFLSVNSLDITTILNNYPDLIAFNDLLTQTKLSQNINHRRTITVLAVDNSSIGGLNERQMDEIQRILSNHVILDYFDLKKLKKLKNNSSVVTLYQTTGNADGRQGYLTINHLPGDQFVFGSAVKDALPVAKLVKSVYSRPFNISILQVSQPIVAPGLGEVILPPPPPPYTPPPAMPPKKLSKSNVSSPPDAEADDDSEFAPSESPIEAPEEAPAPAPVEAPSQSPPEPSNDEDAAPAPSSVSHLYAGSGVAVAALVAMVLGPLSGFFK